MIWYVFTPAADDSSPGSQQRAKLTRKKNKKTTTWCTPPPPKKRKKKTLCDVYLCSISVLDTGRPHDTEKDIVNVNVNVEVYSLKSPWVQQTLQFTPLVLELSLIRSHLLWGEFSAFSAADAIHNFSNFHSTRYPSLLGGQRRHGMRGFAQHLYTLINFSDLRECLGMFTWRRHLRCVIVQQTLQFTPLVLELSLIRSHLLWGEFSACSAADAIHNFSNFHSTRYPSLLGGQRRHDMLEVLPNTSTH